MLSLPKASSLKQSHIIVHTSYYQRMSRLNCQSMSRSTTCISTSSAGSSLSLPSTLCKSGREFEPQPITWRRLANVDEGEDYNRSTMPPLTRFLETKTLAHHDDQLRNSFYMHEHHKRHNNSTKTLAPAEMLPRNEVLGGYIFVCNNETMQDDLHRQLFGLPPKYKDSVRAIIPGLPLFLYNYTTHQLHGVYQAVSFGGSNIDPTAWEDKKCRSVGSSRFPAQVRVRTKKKYKPLEEDAFRPILYHYDGPKFRLQLSVPEALALLDLFEQEDF